jgi:D-alanine-D-alanine ligase-like ATP-grasp enzyme
MAGIDFMTADITQPQTQDSYKIIEINAAPEFDIHDIPMYGKKRNIAQNFLYTLFPDLSDKTKKS